MARQILSPRFHRLMLFMLDSLLRRSIRGCRIIWAALWRLLTKCFALHLRHRLMSLRSALHWKESGHSTTYSNAHVRSPSYGLSDPVEGVSIQGTEVVAGSALPYMVSHDFPSADLSSPGSNAQMLPTAGAQTDDLVITEILSIPPAHPPLPSSSGASSDDDHRHGRSEDEVSSSAFSRTSSSSETLNNIPMHPIPVEPRSLSDVDPAIPLADTSNIIPQLGSIGSRGSFWEISEYIWPMIPTQVPRYKNNRIM
jgi:hypothetical protein